MPNPIDKPEASQNAAQSPVPDFRIETEGTPSKKASDASGNSPTFLGEVMDWVKNHPSTTIGLAVLGGGLVAAARTEESWRYRDDGPARAMLNGVSLHGGEQTVAPPGETVGPPGSATGERLPVPAREGIHASGLRASDFLASHEAPMRPVLAASSPEPGTDAGSSAGVVALPPSEGEQLGPTATADRQEAMQERAAKIARAVGRMPYFSLVDPQQLLDPHETVKLAGNADQHLNATQISDQLYRLANEFDQRFKFDSKYLSLTLIPKNERARDSRVTEATPAVAGETSGGTNISTAEAVSSDRVRAATPVTEHPLNGQRPDAQSERIEMSPEEAQAKFSELQRDFLAGNMHGFEETVKSLGVYPQPEINRVAQRFADANYLSVEVKDQPLRGPGYEFKLSDRPSDNRSPTEMSFYTTGAHPTLSSPDRGPYTYSSAFRDFGKRTATGLDLTVVEQHQLGVLELGFLIDNKTFDKNLSTMFSEVGDSEIHHILEAFAKVNGVDVKMADDASGNFQYSADALTEARGRAARRPRAPIQSEVRNDVGLEGLKDFVATQLHEGIELDVTKDGQFDANRARSFFGEALEHLGQENPKAAFQLRRALEATHGNHVKLAGLLRDVGVGVGPAAILPTIAQSPGLESAGSESPAQLQSQLRSPNVHSGLNRTESLSLKTPVVEPLDQVTDIARSRIAVKLITEQTDISPADARDLFDASISHDPKQMEIARQEFARYPGGYDQFKDHLRAEFGEVSKGPGRGRGVAAAAAVATQLAIGAFLASGAETSDSALPPTWGGKR